MKTNLTASDLIAFEEDIAKCFSEKMIRSPIHLDSNNEDQLIHIFNNYVNEEDWCLGSWRGHYISLLKGVPPETLKQAILKGRSIGLCFSDQRVVCSGIVSGTLPIAVGIAMSIKRQGKSNKVVCFMGDMTSETGTAHECIKYSTNHNLPLLWVVADNNKSVCTPTREVWGTNKLTYEPENYEMGTVSQVSSNVLYYKYSSRYPHAGHGGARIQF